MTTTIMINIIAPIKLPKIERKEPHPEVFDEEDVFEVDPEEELEPELLPLL